MENSINVHHYQQVLSQELFDIKMMEMKRDLQNLLFTFMIAEPRLESIFDQSPYTNIRAEAYDFLEDSGRVDTL